MVNWGERCQTTRRVECDAVLVRNVCADKAADAGGALEHAQYDRTDESNRNIRSYNTQPTEQWTVEGHWELSLFGAAVDVTTKLAEAFPEQNVSLADPLSPTAARQSSQHG